MVPGFNTLSDPIYALPLVVTATMWGVLEVSPGSAKCLSCRVGGKESSCVGNGHPSLPGETELMGKRSELVINDMHLLVWDMLLVKCMFFPLPFLFFPS